MMSTGLLETCSESRKINTYKRIVPKGGYSLELYRNTRSPEYKILFDIILFSKGPEISHPVKNPSNSTWVSLLGVQTVDA